MTIWTRNGERQTITDIDTKQYLVKHNYEKWRCHERIFSQKEKKFGQFSEHTVAKKLVIFGDRYITHWCFIRHMLSNKSLFNVSTVWYFVGKCESTALYYLSQLWTWSSTWKIKLFRRKLLKYFPPNFYSRQTKYLIRKSIFWNHNMFSLYADPRQRKSDIKDILMTAKVLALDTKF